jgi:hypothetical protein
MKRFYVVIAALAVADLSMAETSDSYVENSKPFVQIENVNREVEAWGMCAATYDVAAMIFESEKPNQAQRYRNFGNGAAISAVMANVLDGLDPEMSPDDFNSLWNYSKTLVESIPETSKTSILADLESADDQGLFFDKLLNTLEACVSNLSSQQDYIDAWREMMKTGMLQSPDE